MKPRSLVAEPAPTSPRRALIIEFGEDFEGVPEARCADILTAWNNRAEWVRENKLNKDLKANPAFDALFVCPSVCRNGSKLTRFQIASRSLYLFTPPCCQALGG